MAKQKMEKTADKSSTQKRGIVLLIVGICICLTGFLLTTNAWNPRMGFMWNVQRSYIEIAKGNEAYEIRRLLAKASPNEIRRLLAAEDRQKQQRADVEIEKGSEPPPLPPGITWDDIVRFTAEGVLIKDLPESRAPVQIPLKYVLLLGVVSSAVGVGMIVIKKMAS